MTALPTLLDTLVQRLQNAPSFNIYQILPTGAVAPWWEVVMARDVIPDIVIHPANITDQAAVVAAQIAHWGRMAAQAKRVWDIEERLYRIWRDTKALAALTPDPSDKDWKKPTEKAVEMLYRADPGYSKECERVERAQEAFAATEAVWWAYKAKQQMLDASPGRNTF